MEGDPMSNVRVQSTHIWRTFLYRLICECVLASHDVIQHDTRMATYRFGLPNREAKLIIRRWEQLIDIAQEEKSLNTLKNLGILDQRWPARG